MFTEENMPYVSDRACTDSPKDVKRTDRFVQVYTVTGSNIGVGKEVAQIPYSKNATVYVFRSRRDKKV